MPTVNWQRAGNLAVVPPGAFRLFLAFLVLVSHSSRLDIGHFAVLLFFLLSGYWVRRIYQSEFQDREWLTFYISRWLRIAPLYFIVVLFAAAVRGLSMGWENFTIFGIASTGRDPTGVSWSLDIELQFYLLAPVLFLLVRRTGLFAVVTALLCGFGWWLQARTGIATAFMYLPMFAVGSLIAETRWHPAERPALVSLAGFVAVTGLILVIPATAVFLDKNKPHPFDLDLFSMVWTLPLLPYVASSLGKRSSAFDRDVGNWSYPLYLVHYPLIAVFVAHGHSKWIGIALAPLVALALYYGPDRFFEHWRRRFIQGAWKSPSPSTVKAERTAPHRAEEPDRAAQS
jgi:peptidoglycan/LPS O-acetylase OafA/YrhL